MVLTLSPEEPHTKIHLPTFTVTDLNIVYSKKMYKDNLDKTIKSKEERNMSPEVDYPIISKKDSQDPIQGKEISKELSDSQ